MAKDDECLNALITASGGKISREEAEDKLASVARSAELYRSRGMDYASAVKQAAADATTRESMAVTQARITSLKNLQKRVAVNRRIIRGVEELRGDKDVTGDHIRTSVEAMLGGINTPIEEGRASLVRDISAQQRDMGGALSNELNQRQLTRFAVRGEHDADVAREMWELSNGKDGKPGVTGNSIAADIAKTYNKYMSLARSRLNAEGAWIGDLPGYITKNEHNWEKIHAAGFDNWKTDVEKWFGNEITFAGMDKVERGAFLKNVYNSVVSGTHTGSPDFKAPAFGGPGNVAKGLSQERLLHPNDADSWYQYQQKYGTSKTLAEATLRTLTNSARQTAVMRTFGTNPQAEFDKMLSNLKTHYRDIDPEAARQFTDKYESNLRRQFDEITGNNDAPKNKLVAKIAQANQVFQQVKHLGQVLFAHGSVPVTRAFSAGYWGENGSVLRTYADFFTSLITNGHQNTPEGKELIGLLKARNDGELHDMLSKAGYGGGGPGVASSIANTHMKLTLLPYFMESQRAGHEWQFSAMLGNKMSQGFDELHPATQQILKQNGIKPADWELLRKVDPVKHEGQNFFTPDMADRIDDKGVEKIVREQGNLPKNISDKGMAAAVAKYKEDLALSLTGMAADESKRALNIPGPRTRALLYQGAKPGTVPGELWRAAMQFKQWPTELILNSFGRAINDNPTTGAKALGLFHLTAGLTVAGYLRMALREATNGNHPPDLSKPETILQAAQEGGAVTMLGDMFAGMLHQHDYGRAIASLGGPTAGDVYDVGKVAWDAAHGKKVKGEASDLAMHQIPFVNLFYTKLLTNYFFLWGLHDMIHPGWSQRYEAAVQKETGQKPYLGPSQAVGVR